MNIKTRLSVSLATFLVWSLASTPSHADNDTSFVASYGGGTACTRAAPCNAFQAAHNATGTFGQINCLDSGPYGGQTTISKSITIDCAGTAATHYGGFIVNGDSIIVNIRHLALNGTTGLTNIDF